jgi:tetratricopeptide (TPR) repeat protein
VEQGRSLQALQVLEEASRARPDEPSIQIALGALYAASGRLEEALQHIERAVALAPNDTSYAYAQGDLLYRSERLEEAKAALEKASDVPESLILLAAIYEKLGPKDAMFSALGRYLDLRPEDQSARRMLGQKLEAEKRYDDALVAYRGGRGPDDPVLLYHAANLLSRDRESYAEAEAQVRKALEISPEMLEARLLLARILERSERYEEALPELERTRKDHPEASQVYYNLATAYRRAGRLDEAQEAAARFQELSRKEQAKDEREARSAATYKRAVDLLSRGNMSEAESVFANVLDIDPEHAHARSMLAKIAFSKGDVQAAYDWITEAIEKDDRVGEFYYLAALFLMRAGNLAEAKLAIERAVQLDETFPDAWSLLGSILMDSRDPERALECFSRAAALEPNNATTQLNLASAYAALGNTAEEEAAMVRYRELSERN